MDYLGNPNLAPTFRSHRESLETEASGLWQISRQGSTQCQPAIPVSVEPFSNGTQSDQS